MRYFKEFKSPRFKRSTLIFFKWGSVLVRFLLWRKRRRSVASLWRTRSSKLISFWMRSGHPSSVDEALEEQSRKAHMDKFARRRFVCWCWGLVLRCYELRTRQHKMLNVNVLRPLKHYFLEDLMNFGRRLKRDNYEG
jgi:hypothetical protein